MWQVYKTEKTRNHFQITNEERVAENKLDLIHILVGLMKGVMELKKRLIFIIIDTEKNLVLLE